MKPTTIKITQEMLTAAKEGVEQAVTVPNIDGLVFLTLLGGEVAIYNPKCHQVLPRRFEGLDVAANFAKARLCDMVIK